MSDGLEPGTAGPDAGASPGQREPSSGESERHEPREPGSAASEPRERGSSSRRSEPRPVIERIGLAGVALVLALLFGGVAAASWVGGEPFLAVMAAIGTLMTIWVGALTLLRG